MEDGTAGGKGGGWRVGKWNCFKAAISLVERLAVSDLKRYMEL